MLAVMSLSQHRVLSSKTFRPHAPCGARCIGHAVSTWSAVCSKAPHSQFGEGARPHLCMDEYLLLDIMQCKLLGIKCIVPKDFVMMMMMIMHETVAAIKQENDSDLLQKQQPVSGKEINHN